MKRIPFTADEAARANHPESSPETSPLVLSRRIFLHHGAYAAAGLTLAVALPIGACSSPPPATPVTAGPVPTPPPPDLDANAFVRVTTDNRVIVTIKHLEMGQGAYNGLATLVAEEMDADWAQLEAQNAPADATRYNNLSWGPVQGTGGSSGLPNAYLQMREAGAAARYLLVSAAAEQWNVPRADLSVRQGRVLHAASNRSASFGELASLASRQQLPASVPLKDPADFVFIGRPTPRLDTGKTNGSARFTQDMYLPDMVTALVAHPPRFGATLTQVDSSAALAVPGVLAVLPIPSGVAVIARSFWQAKQGRDALRLEWDESRAVFVDTAELLEQYHLKTTEPGRIAVKRGQLKQGFRQSSRTLESSFEFPFLSHAAMEPMNCVVQQKPDGIEVWNGCQLQTMDQQAVARVFGVQPAQVKINTLFAGGSFGRRANPYSDYVVEAAQIARAYERKVPVKLVWTREDDLRAGYFRPLYVHHLKAGLNRQGEIVAWRHRIIGQSILKGTPFEAMMVKDGIDQSSVEGAANLPYTIPNFRVELTTVDPGVPVQWWRSVGSTHTAFATEHFLDRIARAAGRDPVQYRLQLLKDHPRHTAVLKLAAEKSGWGKPLPKGVSLGIAVHESFNTCVAQVAQVRRLNDGRFKVEKVVCAVDCGLAVNPDVIAAQMEGGIGYGLSPALMSAVNLQDGKVVESNFHDYKVARIQDMPDVDVHIVPSAAPPTGVGEPGTPVIAPAIANALLAATGKPSHRLPLEAALA